MNHSVKLVFGVLVALTGLLISSGASAVLYPENYYIYSVGPNVFLIPSLGGTGSASCQIGSCAVTKEFTAIGDIPVVVDVIPQTPSASLTSPDLLHFDETITNSSGVDWTNFEFGFISLDASDLLTIEFSNVSNPTGEFTSSAYPLNGLSLFGSVPDGDTFDLSFDLIITSQDFAYNLFAVTESPSVPSVPEPATIALLGIAFAGMGFGRRRRRSA